MKGYQFVVVDKIFSEQNDKNIILSRDDFRDDFRIGLVISLRVAVLARDEASSYPRTNN